MANQEPGPIRVRTRQSNRKSVRLLFCQRLAKKCLTHLCDVRTSVNFPKRDNDHARIHDNNIALIRLDRGQSEGITVPTAEIATPAEQAADSNLLKLLIVDDERAVRESCREVAEALGFHTTITDSPKHCCRILDGTNVDVIPWASVRVAREKLR